MDIGRAITFFTEDEQWVQKIGIGIGVVLLSMILSSVLIGFLGLFILSGYSIRLLQNVRDGQQRPLPEWDEWGADLARGFKYYVVTLVWSLAAVLMVVPMTIGGALADSGGGGEFIGSVILICTSCLLMLYGIFVALASPGFTIAFAHDERIGSGLKVTDIWRWTQANLGQVIIAMLVIMAVSFVVVILAGIVGLILCIIGLIVTIPFATLFVTLFQHHLYGQLAREHPMYDRPLGVPAPLPPVPPSEDFEDVTAGSEVAVMADEIAERGEEIGAAVDDIVEESADAVENAAAELGEVIDPGNTDTGPADIDLDPEQKP